MFYFQIFCNKRIGLLPKNLLIIGKISSLLKKKKIFWSEEYVHLCSAGQRKTFIFVLLVRGKLSSLFCWSEENFYLCYAGQRKTFTFVLLVRGKLSSLFCWSEENFHLCSAGQRKTFLSVYLNTNLNKS